MKPIREKQPRPIEKVLAGSTGPIWQLNKNDVLSGKGSKSQDHEGNIQYRKLVNQTQPRYSAETKKLKKKFIAADVVEEIRNMEPPGRFLKRDYEDCPYYEIGDKEAFEKAQQAIRDAAPDSETVAMEAVEDRVSPMKRTAFGMKSFYPVPSSETTRAKQEQSRKRRRLD